MVNGVGSLRAERRRRAAADAIRQHSQLRHLGAVRLGAGDCRHRRHVAGRRAMNLLTLVLLAAAGGLPRRAGSSRARRRRSSRIWALAMALVTFVASLGLLFGSTAASPASSSPSTCPGSPSPEIHFHVGRRRHQPLAGAALHFPHAHLHAGLLALHRRIASKSSSPSCCCWNSAWSASSWRRTCSCSTCSGKSRWCPCTS